MLTLKPPESKQSWELARNIEEHLIAKRAKAFLKGVGGEEKKKELGINIEFSMETKTPVGC